MKRFSVQGRRNSEGGVVRSWARANRLNELANVGAKPSVARSFLRRYKKEAALLDSPEADVSVLVSAYRKSLKASSNSAPSATKQTIAALATYAQAAPVVSEGQNSYQPSAVPSNLLCELADLARKHGIEQINDGLLTLRQVQLTNS